MASQRHRNEDEDEVTDSVELEVLAGELEGRPVVALRAGKAAGAVFLFLDFASADVLALEILRVLWTLRRKDEQG